MSSYVRARKARPLAFAAAAVAALACSLPSLPAHARSPVVAAAPQTPQTPSAPGSWADQLDGLATWLDAHREKAPCAERCFALERLVVSGSLDERGSPLDFELEGALLTPGPVDVPLFGPAAQVRLTQVTESGRPAEVSFDTEGYFARVTSKRFVLRGKLALGDDLSLTVPGPINTFEAKLRSGRVVEGASLSGVEGTTLHFDRELADTTSGPPVFELSRALRFGRETTFEYRLTLRSGAELGVVRLPLRYREKVLDVEGATGWKLEGDDLVLPTNGKTADVVVHGTMPAAHDLVPDERSTSEWWLVESDAEHRLTVGGDASQVDAAQSPIPRTQTGARLYLVKRGQRLELTVQTLSNVDVLAAVARSQSRTLVLTSQNDLVADDTLVYENSGVDYLAYDTGGKPLFLAVDGAPVRVMHDDHSADSVMIPLATGSHAIRVQSLSHASMNPFAGSIALPVPTYALTTSASTLTLGLPSGVRPIAVTGGDRSVWFLGLADLFAVIGAAALAWLALRGSRKGLRSRALATVALVGLWFLAPAAYFAVGGAALAVTVGAFLASRLPRGRARSIALTAGALAIGGAALVLLGAMRRTREPADAAMASREQQTASELAQTQTASLDAPAASAVAAAAPPASPAPMQAGPAGAAALAKADDARRERDGDTSGLPVINAGSVLRGVTPVALTLPRASFNVTTERELVTRERPFTPHLLYVTDLGLVPLLLGWLAAVLLLVRAERDRLVALRDALARALRPTDPAASSAGAAPATAAAAAVVTGGGTVG